MGDVTLRDFEPRGSGEAGDTGDVGSLSIRLPLTLSILNGKWYWQSVTYDVVIEQSFIQMHEELYWHI